MAAMDEVMVTIRQARMPGGGFGWVAVCKCGWASAPRRTLDGAEADAESHDESMHGEP